jgi:FkbM family methyltransferase
MVFRQIFLDREADITLPSQGTAVVDKYGEILARGRIPLIIDCGANNGMSSIFLASLFPMAIVAAIEPSGENFKLLALNVAPFELIKPIHAGIWNTRTHLKILNRNGSPCGFRTVECETNDPEAIAALSVPDILERFSNCDPLLIKVDVEGAEDNLFACYPGWVDKMPGLIVELHDWMLPGWETSRNFLACMVRMRCDFVLQGENVFVFNWAALPKASRDKSIE